MCVEAVPAPVPETCADITGGYFVSDLEDSSAYVDYCRIRQQHSMCDFEVHCALFQTSISFVNETSLYMPMIGISGELQADGDILWEGPRFYELNPGTKGDVFLVSHPPPVSSEI